MPKPITVEMLTAMSPDERKTLHRNASALDTPAARQVLDLLSKDDLMERPKSAAAKKVPVKKAAKTATAKHGRQS